MKRIYFENNNKKTVFLSLESFTILSNNKATSIIVRIQNLHLTSALFTNSLILISYTPLNVKKSLESL